MSRADRLLLGLAAAYATLQVASGLVEPYGLFHDEYYYWANAMRPGFGYVDHPPFAPWVLTATIFLLGDSLVVFGIVPALCGGALVYTTGLMARRLGAGDFGQCLAAVCAASSPLLLAFFNFYSVNAFEFLFWSLAGLALIELIRSGDERYWLALGVICGLGLLNKHTIALLFGVVGLVTLASPLRAHLRGRWLWLGAAVALLIASPNLVWNALNDWPSLDFYRAVGADKNIATSLGDAITFQLVGNNPATALIWLPGLVCLLFSARLRRYRPLGILFAILLVVMLTSGQRRGDRIVGVYPLVWAAGAAVWDAWAMRNIWARRARPVLLALVVLSGTLLLPASLPLFSLAQVEAFFKAIDQSPELEAGDAGHAVPLQLLGRLEWDRMADQVLDLADALPIEDRQRAVILAPHWVLASSIEYMGRDRAAPPVVSPTNAYWFWRDDAVGRDVVISLDVPAAALARHFGETREIGLFECEHCANWRHDMTIALSREPRKPLPELLAQWRFFGAGRAPALSE